MFLEERKGKATQAAQTSSVLLRKGRPPPPQGKMCGLAYLSRVTGATSFATLGARSRAGGRAKACRMIQVFIKKGRCNLLAREAHGSLSQCVSFSLNDIGICCLPVHMQELAQAQDLLHRKESLKLKLAIAPFFGFKKKRNENYAGRGNSPYFNYGKGDTLVQKG
eukprot:1154964-Pelagomonas_calceolata.AAC.4